MDSNSHNGNNLPTHNNLPLNQQPLKWTTTIDYIDSETGEQITKKNAKANYILIKKIIHKSIIQNGNGTKRISHICKRDNQLEIRYKPTTRKHKNT